MDGRLLDAFRRFQDAQAEAYDTQAEDFAANALGRATPALESITILTPVDLSPDSTDGAVSGPHCLCCARRVGLLLLIALGVLLLVFVVRCRRGAHGPTAQGLFGGARQGLASEAQSGVKVIDTLSSLHGAREPAVVLFWSAGCPHCENAKPTFEALAASRRHGSYWSYSADGLARDASARGLKIEGFPTFVAFRGREEVGRLVGDRGWEALKDFVDSVGA